MTRPLNIEELTERADRIFIGRCVHVKSGWNQDLRQTTTTVTFVTQRWAKGNAHEKVTIELLGDETEDGPPGRGLSGFPRFQEGEQVVLFLYGDSARGLTSPVGLGQGKFVVSKDKKGKRLALNGAANETLFKNLSPGALKKVGDAAARAPRGAVDPDALLDMVQQLSHRP